jgi:UDP-glucose-4-epimerase GalE
MRVLVTGGAGYVGSHVVKALAKTGHEIVVLDSLERGFQTALKWGHFERGDLKQKDATLKILQKWKPEAVVHTAAYTYVGESVEKPKEYFENNINGTLHLLEAMKASGCSRLIFSSTCSVYGNSEKNPIDEREARNPVNPYAKSKALVEKAIEEAMSVWGLDSVILRFFNVAGADLDGEIGESHDPETHLIPLLIQAALTGKKDFKIFGNDYPTRDGTCIRDYVHVVDLAQAHVASLDYLSAGKRNNIFNVGCGAGYSVLEILKAVEMALDLKIPYQIVARREGDPAALIADTTKIRQTLNWSPRHSDLKTILSTAIQWEKSKLAKSI